MEKARVDDSSFVSVAVLAALVAPTGTAPHGSVAGLMESGRFPVPLRATVCGESGALSLMAREPLMAPGTAGVKLTLTVQEAPGASAVPQPLGVETEKSPVAPMELMFTVVPLVFLRVTVLRALLVPTACG